MSAPGPSTVLNQGRTDMTRISTLLVTLLLIAATAGAQVFRPHGQELRFQPTEEGYACNASGVVAMWQTRNPEYEAPCLSDTDDSGNCLNAGSWNCGIRASAELQDGTVLVVWITKLDGHAETIGAITLHLGSGRLMLNSDTDPDSPVWPMEEVQAVHVSLNNEVLLWADFHPSPVGIR